VAQYQDIQQLYQEVQSYQQHFVELHRATTAATPTGEDPAALKVKLVQLDSQKQQLQDKLLKIRGKVQNVANLPALQVQSDSTCRSTLINSLACMILFTLHLTTCSDVCIPTSASVLDYMQERGECV